MRSLYRDQRKQMDRNVKQDIAFGEWQVDLLSWRDRQGQSIEEL